MARRGPKPGSKRPAIKLAREEEALVRFVNLKIDPENVSDGVHCLLNAAGGDWQSLGRREETSPPFWTGLNLEGRVITADTLEGYQGTIRNYFRACIATKGSGKSKAFVPDTIQHSVSEKLSRCQVRYNFETGRWSPAVLSQEAREKIHSEDVMARLKEMVVREHLASIGESGLPGLLSLNKLAALQELPVPPQNVWVTSCFDFTVQIAPTLAQFLTHYAANLRECYKCHLIFLKRKNGSSLFGVGDLKDPASLATKLRDARDSLSQHIRGQFPLDTQQLLDSYDGSSPPSELLQEALINGLNQLIRDGYLYNEQRFVQTTLTNETRRLIEQNPQGEDLILLNRLLLEEAHLHEIAKSRKNNIRYCSKECQQKWWQDKRAEEGYHTLDMRKRRDPNSYGYKKYRL